MAQIFVAGIPVVEDASLPEGKIYVHPGIAGRLEMSGPLPTHFSRSNRPPFETFKNPTCRGCYALGSACGSCEKCAWEREQMVINSHGQLNAAINAAVGGESANLDAVAELSDEEIQLLADTFSYHPASPDDLAKYAAVRSAAKHFAMILMLNVPKCADRTAAMRKIREAMMTANAAIALKGKI